MHLLYDKHKKTGLITRRTAKYICFAASALVIIIYLIVVANRTLNLVKNNSERTLNETSRTLVHEYALISKGLFQCACAELKQFSNADYIPSAKNKDEVCEWLLTHKKRMPDYFNYLSFSDVEGNSVISDGTAFNVKDRKYYREIIEEGKNESVSGPFNSKVDGEEVILVAQKVTDEKGKTVGVMCASIKLSTLKNLAEELDIKNDGHFFIIGDEGRFVAFYDQRLWGKTYTPRDEKYENLSSEFISKVRYGVFETKSIYNRDIWLYIEPIENTSWTCGITVDKSIVYNTHNQLKNEIIFVIVKIIILIGVFLFVSYFLLNNHKIWRDYIDELTGLWTRPKFEAEAQIFRNKYPDDSFVVMEIDFRGFKFINQTYGTDAGDNILKNFADMGLIKCKELGAICCRGYADHFYFFHRLKTVGLFMEGLDKFIEEFHSYVEQQDIPAYPKFGITFIIPNIEFYSTPKTIFQLIGEASYAKGTIKENYLQNYAIYSKKMQEISEKEQRIERHMEKALSHGEFFIVFQPKISLKDEKIKGAEALVRWNSTNSKLGFMSPAEFIPVFERNGFIVKLDFAVYEMVFQFLRKQLDEGNPVIPISVNMSRNHKNPDKFVNEFVKCFKKYNLPPELIEIEILEQAGENDNYNLAYMTKLLHEQGFSVAMDDFGSGQSSLNMLSEIPIDVLKFDRQFLRGENEEDNQFKMISTLLELGKQLNKKTLFEGVETEQQRDMLRDLNCDQVQGYFYSKPLTESEFVQFVKENI